MCVGRLDNLGWLVNLIRAYLRRQPGTKSVIYTINQFGAILQVSAIPASVSNTSIPVACPPVHCLLRQTSGN
jgi:hypothetical protein